MSIFGTRPEGLNVQAMENYTVYGGDIVAMEECMTDMLGVIESIHAHDMAEIQADAQIKALQESGASEAEIEEVRENYTVVMEGAAKDMYDKLVQMLKNLWAKIKGYFKSMVRFFEGLTKSGKDFVKKYEKDLLALDLTGYTPLMYDWNEGRLTADANVDNFPLIVEGVVDQYVNVGGSLEKVQAAAKVLGEKKEEILGKIRGKFVGEASLDASDYNEAIFKYFRKGATGADDKKETAVKIHEIIAILKEDKTVTKLKKAEANVDKVFSDKIKTVSKTRDEFEKAVRNQGMSSEEGQMSKAQANLLSRSITIFNEGQSIALTFVRGWKDAVVARNREYKNVCVAAFRYKADKE